MIWNPEGEEREKEIENVFEEIMAENFPHLKKETDIQEQEAQRISNKMNPIRPTQRHIIIKMATLKIKRERECQDTFKVMKVKNLQPRILYRASLCFRIEREIKKFSDKQKLKEFINAKSTLKEMLKGLL